MQLESRTIASAAAQEVYLAAIGNPAVEPAGEARRMFAAINEQTAACGGRVWRLRAFIPTGAEEAYRQARRAVGGAQAAACCTFLRAGEGAAGGVQAHVVAGPTTWKPLLDDAGATAGWACQNGSLRWAAIAGLCKARAADQAVSTYEVFESARRMLAQADMKLSDVARTWFFLDDILSWYGPFNAGRNRSFQEHQLLGPGPAGGLNVPASTGIGASPACGSATAMELFAVTGSDTCVIRHASAGKQRCAYEYGSAFARVAEAASPAGRTVFISGTAAIDTEGRTCCPGDAAGQIRMTIQNVQAVLTNMRCDADDVVEAIAYCKTPAIAWQFAAEFKASCNWPWVDVVCDVCRGDLLFEVEATACRP